MLLNISIILLLLIFSGFFSGSETALFSLSSIQRERFKRAGNRKSLLINKLLSRPRKLIITILIGNDMVNIAASVIATSLFVSYSKDQGQWIAMAVMTPMTLIFAEVIPKTLALTYNERIAPFVSTPLYFFSQLILPIRFVFYNISLLISKISGFEKRNVTSIIMEDEFRALVDESHESGEINRAERDLIHNIFEFSDTHAFEIMTPLNEIFSLSEDMTIEKAVKEVHQSRFLRIPVYRDSIDNIVGILYTKDLLKIDITKYSKEVNTIRKICRKPFFVNENIKTDDLFHILKRKRIHIAICVNKQGKITGLLTMDDLLGELFGEIHDEYDRALK
ncbi:MAG: HlyC/CorC family transporter [Thermodesulfobacteriota bacterium]|nr:HlyC/CorC family transporter [Thermodesulfobacteriota bacterium]